MPHGLSTIHTIDFDLQRQASSISNISKEIAKIRTEMRAIMQEILALKIELTAQKNTDTIPADKVSKKIKKYHHTKSSPTLFAVKTIANSTIEPTTTLVAAKK
jgi:predicted  nucleic acid-binding Zn-ribbon protein